MTTEEIAQYKERLQKAERLISQIAGYDAWLETCDLEDGYVILTVRRKGYSYSAPAMEFYQGSDAIKDAREIVQNLREAASVELDQL